VLRLHAFGYSNARAARICCSEEDLSLGVLFFAENEGSASLNGEASLELLLSTFSFVHDCHFKLKCCFLGELSCSAENGFGLASKSLLFRVIATFALSRLGVLSLFVLRDLPGNVLACFSAVRAHCFGIMHLRSHIQISSSQLRSQLEE